MGNILEKIKSKTEAGKAEAGEAKNKGLDAVKKATDIRKILDSMPEGVDDEIKDAIMLTQQESKRDAMAFVEQVKKAEGTAAEEKFKEVEVDASKLISENKRVEQNFGTMESISNFARAAIRRGITETRSSTALAGNELSTARAERERLRQEMNQNALEIDRML